MIIGYVKTMCRHLDFEGWSYKNPIENIRRISSIRTDKRELTKEETKELLSKIYKNYPDVWFPIIFTGLRLALRKGELLTLG
jgi:integrase